MDLTRDKENGFYREVAISGDSTALQFVLSQTCIKLPFSRKPNIIHNQHLNGDASNQF